MDNLRLILIVVALLAILALLIHGFWINKKERSSLFNKNNKKSQYNKEHRIILQEEHQTTDIISDKIVADSSDAAEIESTIKQNEQALLPEEELKEPEPIQCDLFADLNDSDDINNADPRSDANVPSQHQEQDVLVLHVTGINGDKLAGDKLLNSILQAGFQYGEMQIFHRHVDPAGNGSVLFSLANMVKPGYLDPEVMPNMSTPGISLFMMIPAFGDNQQNFKMMLQSAQRIADDVNGLVLDDEHHMITPQKIASYRERIKKVTGK
jgi:cell division protein ZipA